MYLPYDGVLSDGELRQLGQDTVPPDAVEAIPGSVNYLPMMKAGGHIGGELYQALKGAVNGLMQLFKDAPIPGFDLDLDSSEPQPSDWNAHAFGKYDGERLVDDWFRNERLVGHTVVSHPPTPPDWWDEGKWPNESFYETGWNGQQPILTYYTWGYVAQIELGHHPADLGPDTGFKPARDEVTNPGEVVPYISGAQTALEGLTVLLVSTALGWSAKLTGKAAIGLYAKNKVSAHRSEVLKRLEAIGVVTSTQRKPQVQRIPRLGVTRPSLREGLTSIVKALGNDDRRFVSGQAQRHISRDVKISTDASEVDV